MSTVPDIGWIEGVAAELDDRIMALRREADSLEALRDDLLCGPPEVVAAAPEPEPEPPQAPEPEQPLAQPSSGSLAVLAAGLTPIEDPEVTEEQVRDVLCRRKHPFHEDVVMEAFDMSRMGARRALLVWVERGIIRHVSGRAATALYEYVPPVDDGTRKRKRGEPLFPVDGTSMETRRGITVPRTGKARGPSGKPGRDKKVQNAGHRVKRARQGT